MSNKLSLPQFSSDKAARTASLDRMRKAYAFTLTYDGHIATVNELPKWEKPGWYYQFKALGNALGLVPSLPVTLWKTIKYKLFQCQYKKPADYIYFPFSPYPDRAFRNDFFNDRYFSQQCVMGTNPIMLQGVNADNPLPKTFKVQEAQLPITQAALDKALVNNELYVLKYDFLQPLTEQLGEVDGKQKYISTPIALFVLKDDGQLQPLAIQLDMNQDTSTDNPIITPDDNEQWKMAKTCVQAADATVHDLWSHAVRIHYLMESIIMVTYRQLDKQHPLLVLLDPHLQYTLSVNVHPLYEPQDGKVPSYGKMFPPDNPGLVAFMGEGMRSFSFKEHAFPNDMKNRHVDNPKLDYPYRDDGQPIWDAVQAFAKEYIELYYHSDEDVLNDYELQAWAAELSGSPEQGQCGINDFPEKFTDRESLAATIGQIIFTTTAHHSAIHYPQTQYSQFVPNMPSALWHPPLPPIAPDAKQAELMQFFPPFSMSFQQAFIYYAVDFKVSRMGEYCRDLFDEKALSVIARYQQELDELAQAQRHRDAKRQTSYPYMNPNNIPNSVSA